MGACPQVIQADDCGNTPACALEVVDKVQEYRGRGVVDQRHQVCDMNGDHRGAAGY